MSYSSKIPQYRALTGHPVTIWQSEYQAPQRHCTGWFNHWLSRCKLFSSFWLLVKKSTISTFLSQNNTQKIFSTKIVNKHKLMIQKCWLFHSQELCSSLVHNGTLPLLSPCLCHLSFQVFSGQLILPSSANLQL